MGEVNFGVIKDKARLSFRDTIGWMNMLEVGLYDLLGYFSSLKSVVLYFYPAKKNFGLRTIIQIAYF